MNPDKLREQSASGAEEMNPDKLDADSASSARNLLVPRVVKKVDPDILLLQETKTDKLVDKIIKYTDRGYQQVQARKKKSHEFYMQISIPKSQKPDDKLFPRQSEQKTHTLNEVLQQSISNVVPKDSQRELRSGTVQGATEVFDFRLSIVGLSVKDHPEIPIMVFLSQLLQKGYSCCTSANCKRILSAGDNNTRTDRVCRSGWS